MNTDLISEYCNHLHDVGMRGQVYHLLHTHSASCQAN